MKSSKNTMSSLLGPLANRIFPNGRGLFSTIRARLYCAFGFAAALTIIGSVTALYEFTSIGRTTNEVLSHSFPATAISLRLAEEASSLVSSAPRLMTALDDETRLKIRESIGHQATSLKQRIERLRELGIENANDIDLMRESLIRRLDALNQAVKGRIAISNERTQLTSSIADTHERIIDCLVPAIDDANFDLMMRTKKAEYDPTIGSGLTSLRRLLEIQSETHLLAGLLMQASLITDESQLEPLRDQISSAKRNIELNLGTISDAGLKTKLAALYSGLSATGSDDGIIGVRASELRRQHDAEQAFAAAQVEAATLKKTVDILVDQQSENARTTSILAGRRIQTGKVLLIALAIAALAGGLLIAWLYVGRNIARRLGSLSNAMRRIANGDLSVQVHNESGDEIAEMAQALQCFRQAMVDVTVARQKETDQAKTSNARKELLEAATRSFEEAVSNVIQTLDRAAQAMDNSARDMAENASRNKEQAIATAAASEQATNNVETVAAAAAEIAQSIEHIAVRVAESASVASKASSEAQAITSAVEELSVSVDEIGQVSALIRNIAEQTNLLALNATIEAARAGDAGRGFAVVAQEVKALAVQTSNATEKIARQIKSIEDTTSRSVRGMQSIAGTIVELNRLAGDVALAMSQQDSVTQEIARNAVAAASGTRHMSSNISEVSNTAVKTGQIANVVLNAARELANQSNLLREEVERYLVKARIA